jgi:hypothetical protein
MGRIAAIYFRPKSSLIYKITIAVAFALTMLAGAVTVSLDTLPEKKKKAMRTARAIRSTARRSKLEILDIWNN